MADQQENATMNHENNKMIDEELGLGPDLQDDPKLKFINANGGDSISLQKKTSDTEFVGLTKEELMQYAKDPYWVKVRWFFFISFWVIWLSMFAAAVVIIIVTPKCPERPDQQWFEQTSIIRAHVRSIKDDYKDDGIGDIQGLAGKLDYFKDVVGSTALLLDHMQPTKDGNVLQPATEDFKAINEDYGSIDDFKSMVKSAHKKGMKVVVTFVPNHTSDTHEWFVKYSAGDEKYQNFYVTSDNDEGTDWYSVGSKYYLGRGGQDKPDLDLTNQVVKDALTDAISFWLNIDVNVDGLLISGADSLFDNKGPDQYFALNATKELVSQWRELFNSFNKMKNQYRVLMLETSAAVSAEDEAELLEAGADVIVPAAGSGATDCTAAKCLLGGDEASGRTLQLSSLTGRIGSEAAKESLSGLHMVLMTLPGKPLLLYGDEIGMTNGADAALKAVTPMQWDATLNAGFSKGTPWLEVNSDYAKGVNVKAQLAHGAGHSLLEVVSALNVVRGEPSFQWGGLKLLDGAAIAGSDSYVAFVRQADDFPGFLVAVNFHTTALLADFVAADLPAKGIMVESTRNMAGSSARVAEFEAGQEVPLKGVHLGPNEGIIVQLIPDAEEA